MNILSDLGIVETIKGSGVIITSYEKALEFVREFKDMQTVNGLIVDIKKSISKQKEEATSLEKKILKLTENISRFQSHHTACLYNHHHNKCICNNHIHLHIS